jgi:hypothetical protein
MQTLRIPTGRKLARLTISPPSYGGGFVRVVMSITSTMQSMSDTREFASAEEAEREGIAWAENQGADVLVIEAG